jgi:hypothetical protein
MMPSLVWDVISQTDITASKVLTNLEQAIAVMIHKWTTSINQNNLSSYNSEPSTWAKLCKTSDTQEVSYLPYSRRQQAHVSQVHHQGQKLRTGRELSLCPYHQLIQCSRPCNSPPVGCIHQRYFVARTGTKPMLSRPAQWQKSQHRGSQHRQSHQYQQF